MKLSEEFKSLPPVGSTDTVKGDLPAVYVFIPGSAATWVIWEYNEEYQEGFGMADLGLGFPELGYVSVEELESLKGPLGLPVEIDKSVKTRFEGYKAAGVPIPSFLQ